MPIIVTMLPNDYENLAYLLRFDTAYGRYAKPVAVSGNDLVIAGRKLRTLRNRDPLDLPWRELGVELVFECTGALTQREDLEKPIRAGAQVVLLSAPSRGEEVETVVHGVNIGVEYAGRFDGVAIRAPVPIGSIADVTFVTSRKTTVDEVNQIFTEEAETERYSGVLGVLCKSDGPRGSVGDQECESPSRRRGSRRP